MWGALSGLGHEMMRKSENYGAHIATTMAVAKQPGTAACPARSYLMEELLM